MSKLLQPQEIEVWYILPVIRKELALSMRRKGLTGRRISALLGVSEAAISQYFSNKRAKELILNDQIQFEVNVSAEEIIKDPSKIIPATQKILKQMWASGVVCDLHKNHCSDLPKDCEGCDLHDIR